MKEHEHHLSAELTDSEKIVSQAGGWEQYFQLLLQQEKERLLNKKKELALDSKEGWAVDITLQINMDLDQEVQQLGGWEQYYLHECQQLLDSLLRIVPVEYPPYSIEAAEQFSTQKKIQELQSLLKVFQLLKQADVEISFIGLFHSMPPFAENIIEPMQALLEAGKIEEAMMLYNQPGRHYR